MKRTLLVLLLAFVLLTGCGQSTGKYDTNTDVPKDNPAFPPLTTSWVIDQTGLLSSDIIVSGDAVLNRLKEDGIAEVVVVVISGVTDPVTWATHYGRWLGLGKTGLSTNGGNNGLVWLIRPDVNGDRITVSPGRGLPDFTTEDSGAIMDQAKDYIDFNNFNRGVQIIVTETDRRLRELAKQH